MALRTWKIAAGLVIVLMVVPAFAQRRAPAPAPHALPKANAPIEMHQEQPKESNQVKKEGKAARQANRAAKPHAGDWLRRYKDLPPEEQRKALENDPQFQQLPPRQQALLRKRLEHFSSLSPEQQERLLSRMETWEHLTPPQKQQARQLFQQIRELPPDRRRAVTGAIREMRDLTPEQRDDLINSDRYKGMFSSQERDLLSGASRLPLAPPGEAQSDSTDK